MSWLVATVSVVLVVVVAAVATWVVWGQGSRDSGPTDAQATGGSPQETEAPAPVDSVALLEGAGVDSVNPAPVPEVVDAWGEYELHRSWSGVVRVFENGDPSPLPDDGGGRFPATMNGCGVAMFLVTFRSVNEDIMLDAQLLNAVGAVGVSGTLSDGWMLSTNCQTPQFAFVSSSDLSNLGDVAYDVTEYRQSSVAPPVVEAPVEAPVQEEMPEIAEPYVVECLPGIPGPALWSDGTRDHADECANAPGAERARRGERICGGLNGWMEASKEEFEELCGRPYPG